MLLLTLAVIGTLSGLFVVECTNTADRRCLTNWWRQ